MKNTRTPCRRFRGSIDLLVCDALSDVHAEKVRQHLNDCVACRQYADALRGLTGSLQEWQRQSETLPIPHPHNHSWMSAVRAAEAPDPPSARLTPVLRTVHTLWKSLPRLPRYALAGAWMLILCLQFTSPDIDDNRVQSSTVPATVEFHVVWQTLTTTPETPISKENAHEGRL